MASRIGKMQMANTPLTRTHKPTTHKRRAAKGCRLNVARRRLHHGRWHQHYARGMLLGRFMIASFELITTGECVPSLDS